MDIISTYYLNLGLTGDAIISKCLQQFAYIVCLHVITYFHNVWSIQYGMVEVNCALLQIQMDSNLWKKIGIKKKQSFCQQNSRQSRNDSQGSTFHLVKCLDNLRNYSQHQEQGIHQSVKKSTRINGHFRLRNQEYHKQHPEDIQILYCKSEPASSDQDHHYVIQKPNKLIILKEKVQHLRNFVKILKKQYFELKNVLQTQRKKINFRLYATQLTQALTAIVRSQVNSQNQKKLVSNQSEKCTKCKNSQKLVQILTKQCWTLQQKIKQKKIPIKPVQSHTSKQDSLAISKDRLIENMKRMIQQLEQKNTITNKDLIMNKTNLAQLQIRNQNNLLYYRQEIQQIKKLTKRKIQQVNIKNDQLQAQLLLMNRKYSQLLSKYEITKQLNVSLQLQRNSFQTNSKISRSSRQTQFNEKEPPTNKTFSSHLKSFSLLEEKNDEAKHPLIKNPFKSSLPSLKIQTTLPYVDVCAQITSPTYHHAFQKLDSLKRQVQRKIKVSKLRQK